MSRNNCSKLSGKAGLEPRLKTWNKERKMDTLLSHSSAGPRTDPPAVRVAVHLVEIDRLLERADPRAGLPEADWQRAAEIPSLPQRMAFMAGRKVLRELLAARLGCAPAAVPITREPDGRLRLAGRAGIEFSLSHRQRWCAVALSTDCAVGVDVEPIQPLAGMAGVVREFFPPIAKAAFAAATANNRQNVFFRWWTRIEAAVKASGRRLDDAVSCFGGVVHESCDRVPGLALAVAARSEGPLTVDWRLP